jgi:hypothetical protein
MAITEEQFKAMTGRVKSKATGVDLMIGIDPGTHTGYAAFHVPLNMLTSVKSMGIIAAMELVYGTHKTYKEIGKSIHVYVEDTRKLRLPKAMQSKGRERGAGSVARDMSIWAEFLEYHEIPHTMCGLSPKEFRQSTDEWFRKKTGWDKRTNEHGRCAAGLILTR